MTKKKALLVIDARPLARNVGGMTRYIAKTLPHLIKSKQLEVILYTDQPIHHSYLVDNKDLKIRRIGKTLISKLSWHLMSTLWLYKDKPDLFWSPRQHLPFLVPNSISSIVTIHDLVWKTCPKTIPTLQRLSEKLFMSRSVNRADHIICISDSTKKLVNQHYPKSIEKTSVIRHGLTRNLKGSIETSPKGDYLLAVGTLVPRKNYINLISGYEKYAKTGFKNLIIVGKKGWLYDDIIKKHENSPFKGQIKLLDNVSDQQLNQLYKQAGALISPSLDEGYGLPPLEATIHGTPLLLSNIPVYKELYPYAYEFFNPLSPEEISEAITSLYNLKHSYYVDLSHNGSWDDCTTRHVNCFLQTL